MSEKLLFQYASVVGLLLFLAAGSVFLFLLSPAELIDVLGVENAYGLLFTAAFVSGLGVLGGAPYYLILIALALNGLHPWFLGLSAAAGVVLGDSVSYFFGYGVRALVSPRLEKIIVKISSFALTHPRLLPVLIFVYGALMPFSNDFLSAAMGLARYPFWKYMIPFGLGNIVYNTWLVFLIVYGGDWLVGIVG